MNLALLLLSCLALSGLTLWLPTLWSVRSRLIHFFILVELAVSVVFLFERPALWSAFFLSIGLYKVFNLWRILRGRMQAAHLRRVTLRSALFLSLIQFGIGVFTSLTAISGYWPTGASYFVALLQLLVAGMLFSSTQRHLRTTKTLQATTAYTDKELPSLSVLIPARNETDDLERCLAALVESNYPKLEIIVLDDCSQNKHTPEIIRSFAHAGVRFIAGEQPDDNWLAKNFAYQQLAEAANGEYLLFCGVDLQLSVGAIRELMTTMLEKDKSMLSILPHNERPSDWRSYLLQPMRYAWELSLPRRLFSRPAVLSTCWIIKRSSLLSAGSFKAASRSILPESYFARATARQDGYSFLRSNLLVSSKPAAAQRATTLRMRYPQLHRRPELVWLLSLVELVCIMLPLPTALIAYMLGFTLSAVVALVSFVLLYVVFLQVTGVMYGRPVVAGIFAVPLAAFYDLLLLNTSMFRYEFGDIHWRERNICLPVMRFDEPTAPAPNRAS